MNQPYTVRFYLKTFTVHDAALPQGQILRDGFPMRDSAGTANYARAIYSELDSDKEHFVLFALNNKNRVIGHKLISTGSLTASLVHPREVFRAALEFGAAALICFHNHPSGDPSPSPEDMDITKRLRQGAELLGFRLLDHIVLGSNDRYYSFSDRGNL